MVAGIQRIHIVDNPNGAGAWRFGVAKPYHSAINQVYRKLFRLMPDVEYIPCTAEERYARYDIELGIDTILNLLNGQSTTVQEKVLATKYETVTVEYFQNWRTEEPGDWFKLKCDFYFTGYAAPDSNELARWILLDWNQVRLAGDKIRWQARRNKHDGARANFRWQHFDGFPSECVVAKYLGGVLTINVDTYGSKQYPLSKAS